MQPIEVLRHLSIGMSIIAAIASVVTCICVNLHIHGEQLRLARAEKKRKKDEAMKQKVLKEYERLFKEPK